MFNLTIDEGISVRTFHPDDAEALFELLERNRPRLRPWIDPSSLPATAQAARIFAIECFFNSFEDPMEVLDSPYFDQVGHHFRGFVEPAMEMGIWVYGKLAGEVSLARLEDSTVAGEFGYWIGEEMERKGIVSRCVSALMDYAIGNMGIERFVIGCAAINQRSRAIPERLGYRVYATIHRGEVVGEFTYDRVIYGIRASEWCERKKSND